MYVFLVYAFVLFEQKMFNFPQILLQNVLDFVLVLFCFGLDFHCKNCLASWGPAPGQRSAVKSTHEREVELVVRIRQNALLST